MSDRLLKESDVLKIAFQLPYIVNSVFFDAVKALPSVDRPQGEWVFKTVFPNDESEFPMGYLVCSVCGSHHSNSTPCNYCDNCGARMDGERGE